MSDDTPQGFGDLLQVAQRMQKEVARVKTELANTTVEGSAGGGMVTAVVNGQQQVVSVKIEEELMSPDEREMLQDLVVAAVNHALTKVADLAQEEMSKVTGGLGIKIPGLA